MNSRMAFAGGFAFGFLSGEESKDPKHPPHTPYGDAVGPWLGPVGFVPRSGPRPQGESSRASPPEGATGMESPG